MEKYLLGIDIGTSACKAAVFTPGGEIIAHASEEYPVYYPAPGEAVQEPDDWWNAVCKVSREITSRVNPSQIAGVGVDGQSWSAVAVDGDGRALCPTPIWTDTSAAEECAFMKNAIPEEEWFGVSGNSVQPGYTLPKILRYKNKLPDVYDKSEYILQSNGFIVYRLTGEATLDLSQGYGLHSFDIRTGKIRADMLKEIGIRPSLIPDPVPCEKAVGRVTAKASLQTGLLQGTPVVAGGLDAACAALGAGANFPGRTQEQGGQAGGMSICTDRCECTPELIMSFHVVPDMWLLQGGTTGGGGAMKWLKGIVSPDTGFAEMDSAAASVAPGSDGLIFLPYLAGERSPIWNPDAKGVFYGLTYKHTKAHIIRAVLEGTAFALRHNIETAAKTGTDVDIMRAMGGSSQSRLWTQIKSDITGKKIEVPAVNEATALGAALLSGVGSGVFESASLAAEKIIKTGRVHIPDAENKLKYDTIYSRYLELYSRLEPMMSGQEN